MIAAAVVHSIVRTEYTTRNLEDLPVLGGVTFPLKEKVCSLGHALIFIFVTGSDHSG